MFIVCQTVTQLNNTAPYSRISKMHCIPHLRIILGASDMIGTFTSQKGQKQYSARVLPHLSLLKKECNMLVKHVDVISKLISKHVDVISKLTCR